jgi:putative Ca2+/H+ antiporter (TMEM165/GDT1 family)
MLVFIYLGRAAAITLFLLLPFSLITVLVFSAVMGFLWLATIPGVWLGGWLYDQRGSYDMVWWLGVAFGIMAAIVHWPIRERSAR